MHSFKLCVGNFVTLFYNYQSIKYPKLGGDTLYYELYFFRMGWSTIVEETFVEGTLVEWNIGRTVHWTNGTLVAQNISRTEHSSNLN